MPKRIAIAVRSPGARARRKRTAKPQPGPIDARRGSHYPAVASAVEVFEPRNAVLYGVDFINASFLLDRTIETTMVESDARRLQDLSASIPRFAPEMALRPHGFPKRHASRITPHQQQAIARFHETLAATLPHLDLLVLNDAIGSRLPALRTLGRTAKLIVLHDTDDERYLYRDFLDSSEAERFHRIDTRDIVPATSLLLDRSYLPLPPEFHRRFDEHQRCYRRRWPVVDQEKAVSRLCKRDSPERSEANRTIRPQPAAAAIGDRHRVTTDGAVVKKTFRTRELFDHELKCYRALAAWDMVPKLVDVDYRSLTIVSRRLEYPVTAALTAGAISRTTLAEQIFEAVAAMHGLGLAHRDLHIGNVLFAADRVRLIDFEWVHEYPRGARMPRLQDAYDLTGKGLPSPAHTKSMHWDKKHPRSLRNVTGISAERMYNQYLDRLKRRLKRVSGHRTGVVSGRGGRIYQSFHSRELGPDHAQRNTVLRFRNMGVGSLQGQKVLDLGSNLGAVSLHAARLGAYQVLGVELDDSRVSAAKAVVGLLGWSRVVSFQQREIQEFLNSTDETFDLVFALAIDAWVGEPARLYRQLRKVVKGHLFLETNRMKTGDEARRALEQAGFLRVEYLGTTTQEDAFATTRLLFRAAG